MVKVFFRHLKNVLSRQDNPETKVRCLVPARLVVPSFAMFSRLLWAPALLNQISLVSNFAFGKFYSISKKVCPHFPRKNSVFVFFKKRFYSQVFVEYFYKMIHNLGIKMFYQNHGIKIMEFYMTWSLPKLRIFLEKLST